MNLSWAENRLGVGNMPKLISLRVVIAASVEVPSIEACKRLQAIIRSAGVVAVLLPEGDNPVDLVEAPTIWFESAHVRHGSEMLPYKPNMPRDVSVRKKKRSKYNDLFDIYERTGRPLTIGEMIEIAGQNGNQKDDGHEH